MPALPPESLFAVIQNCRLLYIRSRWVDQGTKMEMTNRNTVVRQSRSKTPNAKDNKLGDILFIMWCSLQDMQLVEQLLHKLF